MGTPSALAFDSSSEESLNLGDALCLPYFLGNVSPLNKIWDSSDWPLSIGEKPIDRSIETDCSDVAAKTSRKRASPRKRKSCGQVLPEPTTSLPPRKRAKTEEEKEQRRIERILRNRRAAHFSRERKRQEVQSLEAYNKALERRLSEVRTANAVIVTELRRIRHARGHQSWSRCADESAISPNDRVALRQDHCEHSISQSTAVSYANDQSTSELPDNIGCPSVDPACLSVSLPVFLGAEMEVDDELAQPSKAQCIEGLEAEKPLNEHDHLPLALSKLSTPCTGLRLDTQDRTSNLGNDFRISTGAVADSSDWGDTLALENALDVSIDSRRDDIAGPFGLGLTFNDELVVEAAKVVTDILVSRCNAADDTLQPEKQDEPSDMLDLTEQAVLLLSNV